MLERLVFRRVEGWEGLSAEARQEVLEQARYRTYRKAGKNRRFLWVFVALVALAGLGGWALYAAHGLVAWPGYALVVGAVAAAVSLLATVLGQLLHLYAIKEEVAKLAKSARKH